ncbi:MAG: Nif3-like dinuclear metal center hexameric protein [Chlamydiales bacterium]|nr:Nif3-like dinuclear metal center hexameric protein [Chlamydiales bacterium]
MITLQELSAHLDTLLTPQDFTDFCPNGIQVEGKKEIRKLGFAVSASVAAIETAKNRGLDALIVHHGVFFNSEPLPICGVKKQKLQTLLTSHISLLAYHLPLDAHPRIGNNWRAALDLNWSDLKPFGRFQNQMLGVQGHFPKMPVEKFQNILEKYYGHQAHTALGGEKEVSCAALLSGGAHKMILEAADKGLDCYITGSFDEPIWDIAHERGIHFFALGHYSTETVGVKALCIYLQELLNIECEFIDLPNPF